VDEAATRTLLLRLLLSQRHVILSTRPQFARQLAPVMTGGSYVQLEPLRIEEVYDYVTLACPRTEDLGTLFSLRHDMRTPALAEAMRSPLILQMAIAVEKADTVARTRPGAAGKAATYSAAAGAGASPIAVLYARVEALLGEQVLRTLQEDTDACQPLLQQLNRADSTAAAAALQPDPSALWRTLLHPAMQDVALAGCAVGEALLPWPAATDAQRRVLLQARVLAGDPTDPGRCVEFLHRSLQVRGRDRESEFIYYTTRCVPLIAAAQYYQR
jgi:hypothetical protein